MKRLVLFLIIFGTALVVSGQSLSDFKAAFTQALDPNLSETEVRDLMSANFRLFLPALSEKPNENPLKGFKDDIIYNGSIAKLLGSQNGNQRTFAYATVGGCEDSRYEKLLLDKLNSENTPSSKFWAGAALINLKTKATTPLFDWLVANSFFNDTPALQLFLTLDSKSLMETAYSRMSATNRGAKILAVTVLSRLELNQKTDELLKKAIEQWDMDTKGYAISAAKMLKIGHLAAFLKPLLNDVRTRAISLDALANSPTEEDQTLFQTVSSQETPSSEYLSSLYGSSKEENIRLWLKLISTKPVPKDYVFFAFQQPILLSDALLKDLQEAIQRNPSPQVLAELARGLEGRTDEKSISILLTLVSNSNGSVRYWSVATLGKVNPPQLRDLLPKLLQDKNLRVSNEVGLAISNNLNGLWTSPETVDT